MHTPRALGRDRIALAAGLVLPLALSAALVPFRTSFPNTDAALALVGIVVAVAANGNRPAGWLAAAAAAIWFDFFLTRPYERFTINSRTDIETTLLLLAIGVAVTELAVWGRRQQLASSERAGYLKGLLDAGQDLATASPQNAINHVSAQLTKLLALDSVQYQPGAAGLGDPPRLLHDGHVTLGPLASDVDVLGLPPGQQSELLVESGGVLQGRFLMTPTPGRRPGREQRLVAIALVDQLAAALSARQADSGHRPAPAGPVT